MDNDKQSLKNADNSVAPDPTQQPIFTPPPTPQPSTPEQNQQVITGSVVEPASTGLSHQYYSNHPTKTSASGIGDIVIGKGGNKKISFKKPLIVGGAVIVMAAIIAVITLILGMGANADKTVVALFDKYNTTIQDAQIIFADAYREKITVNEIFNEQFSDKLNGYSGSLGEFNSAIAKIKSSQLPSRVRDDFVAVQQEIINFVNSYRSTVDLYNKLYASYDADNSSNLTSLVEDENYAATVLVDRFETFFKRKQKLLADISAKHCPMSITINDTPSTECEYLVDAYRENLLSLQNSTVVVRTIFSAYDGTIYDPQSELIYQKMQRLAQKISKTEENGE